VKRQSILAGASIMAAAALLSRILGWVRDRSIGHYWGSTHHTDAYWAAFGVPDLLYYLLAGGAIGAALIPVFSGYLRRDEAEESWHAANTLITLFLLVAAVGVICIMVFAPQLVILVAPGFIKKRGLEASVECAGFVRILAPMVFFTMLSGFFTAILQSHRHFTAPALAWLVYNFGIIGGALAGGEIYARRYGPVVGLKVVCLGVVTGAVLLVVVQVPSMVARGFRFRPRLDLKHPGVREVIRLFIPYMAGLAFTQICLLWLPNYFGSYFTEGAITSLRYANRLVVLPLGLFGIAISTAAFPAMAERAHAGETAEFRRLISGSLRAVLFLSVPCAAALIVLAGPILRLLWRSGKFGEGAIGAAEFCLLYYALALIGLSVLQVVNRAFYSLKDARTPPLVGVGYTAIIVGLAVLSVRMGTRLQYAGIAAATSVGVTVGMIVLFELLRRRLGGVNGGEILRSFLRFAVASAVLAVVALYVSRWSGQLLHVPATHFATGAPVAGSQSAEAAAPITRVAVQVLASMVAGGAAYLVTLWLLGASELASLRDVIRRRQPAPAPVVE
jgi:putative peptidoglycan lipid II flippase